jgi:putative dehydrogenase
VGKPTTVGVLSPGEMGAALGRRLSEKGMTVLAWLEGRSEATRRRAREAGIEPVDRLEDLMAADLILSVVPPAQAPAVAEAIAQAAARSAGKPLYLDLNAVSPTTVRALARPLQQLGFDVVDGAIFGGAHEVDGRTFIALAGPAAEKAYALLHPALALRLVGPGLGDASGLKMLYAGLTKGISSLAVELLAAAAKLQAESLILELWSDRFPDLSGFLAAGLPGLPARAGRRAQEMAELEAWLTSNGLPAAMAKGAKETLTRLAEAAPKPTLPLSLASNDGPQGA